MALAAAGGAILASPIALPAILASAGGYMVVAGTVMTTISQVTVENNKTDELETNG